PCWHRDRSRFASAFRRSMVDSIATWTTPSRSSRRCSAMRAPATTKAKERALSWRSVHRCSAVADQMRAIGLVVRSFRNLSDATIELPEAGVALVGPNGHGKTNLLEALAYPV